MNIEYKVQAYNKVSRTQLVRSAPDKYSAGALADIFAQAPELTNITFGWDGEEPIINDCGDIPESIKHEFLLQ